MTNENNITTESVVPENNNNDTDIDSVNYQAFSKWPETVGGATSAVVKKRSGVLKTCEKGHLYRVYSSSKNKKCSTCNLNENINSKRLRDLVEEIFEKPFSKYSPDWCINPSTGRGIFLKMVNDDLKLAFECDTTGLCGKEITERRNKLCVNNGYLYVNLSISIDRIHKYYERISKHLTDSYHDDIYVSRVLKKIKDLEPQEAYGKLDHGIVEKGNYTAPVIDPEFEKELIRIGQITYFGNFNI